MPQRFIVSFGSSTIPEEWTDFRCTNTLYYQNVSGAQSGEIIAQAIADAYALTPASQFVYRAIQVRAYDFDGVGNTGAPVAIATADQPFGSNPGPREVAVALSYRAGPSTPRSRGRIYLGPVANPAIGGEYVSQDTGNAAKGLAQRLLSIVTLGAEWSLYSRTVQGFAGITNFSVDNAWDTQRSRGLPPTANL
jgi:hypothetical protein